MLFPASLAETTHSTFSVALGFIVAVVLGLAQAVIAQGKVAVLLILFFGTTLILTSMLGVFDARYKPLFHFSIIFNYLILSRSVNREFTESVTEALSLLKATLLSCGLNGLIRCTLAFPGRSSTFYRAEVGEYLTRYGVTLSLCLQSLGNELPPAVSEELSSAVDRLLDDTRTILSLTNNVRKELRFLFNGRGEDYIAVTGRIQALQNGIIDFAVLSIRRVQTLEQALERWSSGTIDADARLREEILQELVPIMNELVQMLHACADHLQSPADTKLGKLRDSFDICRGKCEDFERHINSRLHLHVPSATRGDWTHAEMQVAPILYLLVALPMLFEQVRACGEAIDHLNSGRVSPGKTFLRDDWLGAGVWFRQQLAESHVLDPNRFISNRPRGTIWWQRYGQSLRRATQAGLRTAVAVVLVGLLGFLPATSELFSLVNGFSAVATLVVIAPERHLGFLVKKGFHRAIGLSVAVVWSWVAYIASGGDRRAWLGWLFHVPIYILASAVARLWKFVYLGVMIGLMFGLAMDYYVQMDTANYGCVPSYSLDRCVSQFQSSGFRLLGVLLAILVSYLSAVIVDPVFAADDLKNELCRLAGISYFKYSLRVQEQQRANESGKLLIVEASREETISHELNLLDRQLIKSMKLVETLAEIAVNEPKVNGAVNLAVVRRIERALIRLSSRISMMMSYDLYSGERWTSYLAKEDEAATRRMQEQRAAGRLLRELFTLVGVFGTPGFVPDHVSDRLKTYDSRMNMAELQTMFGFTFCIPSQSETTSCCGASDKLPLRLDHSLAQVVFLKLVCIVRIQQLICEAIEGAREIYGHDRKLIDVEKDPRIASTSFVDMMPNL